MTTTTLLLFTTVALIAIATPGPTVLLALNNGARFGLRLAGFGLLGALLSDLLLIGAVALGLGALLAASALAFAIVKWLGVAYLAYLGLALLFGSGAAPAPGAENPDGPPGRPGAVFAKSLLVAVTNPKGYLFFSALLPQFVTPAAPQWPQYAALALVFVLVDAAVMLAYAALGARAGRWLRRSGARWLDRLCGGCLLALAGSLAAYRRA